MQGDVSATPAKSAGTPVLRWLLLLAVLLVAPLILGAAILAWRMWSEHRAVTRAIEAEESRLQVAGEPITTEELYAFHRVPDGVPDTTAAWLTALHSLDMQRFTMEGKGIPIVDLSDRDLLRPDAPGSRFTAAEAFLQAFEPTLQATLDASRQPGQCRYPAQFEKGVAELHQGEVQKVRSLVKLLALDARVKVLRADADGALQSVAAIFAASDTLGHQPTMLGQTVRFVTLSMALDEAEYLLGEVDFSAVQLSLLQERIASSDVQGNLTYGLLGERALGLQAFRQINAPTAAPNATGAPARPVDCQKYLELMAESIAASRQPFPGGRERLQDFTTQLGANARSAPPWDQGKYALTAMVLPSITSAFDRCAQAIAKRDVLVTAFAAMRYRLESHEFPSEITDLVPDYLSAIPIDPYDGKPLRLQARSGKVVVYSVGKDGKDDNADQNPAGNSDEPDILIQLSP